MTLIYNDFRKRRIILNFKQSVSNIIVNKIGQEINLEDNIAEYLLKTQFNGETPCFIKK
jgi:hypothetical protein